MNPDSVLCRPALIVGLFLITGYASGRAGADEADWLQFRGPGGAGISSAKGVPTRWDRETNLLWKAEPGPGSSSCIVKGERLFLCSYSGYGTPGQPRGDISDLKRHLICLDARTGKTRWTRSLAARMPEQETIREEHGYASSTPVADDDRVYAFFGKSGVFAFDHDGTQLWQADVGTRLNGWGSAASPILYRNLVLVNASVESESLVALDRASGKEVWRAKGIRESWATPILVPTAADKVELVVPIFRKLLGLDPNTGDLLWSCDTEINWYMVPTPVAHAGVVYCIGGRSGGALAVRSGGRGDVTATHRLWTGRKGSNVSSPVYHAGHLYWANDNLGIVYCADAKTGDLVYEQRLGRADQIYAGVTLIDNRLCYTDRGGRTFVVAVGPKYELLATNDLPDRSRFNACATVAGGRLYLRSNRSLYCLGEK